MKTPLSDRMKEYEDQTKIQFPNDSIIVARIDGRGFSKLTKKFDKPFDKWFTNTMIDTMKALVRETCATVGYTQSDEISLIWHTDNPEGQVFFNGKLQKLCSVCASIATAVFNSMYNFDECNFAVFDCRVFTVPSKAEAVNYLFYRQKDCIRNSISMAAHERFGHKELIGKNTSQKLEMLTDAGISWNDYRTPNRIGTFAQRQQFESTAIDHATYTEVPCIRTKVCEIPFDEVVDFETMSKVVFG